MTELALVLMDSVAIKMSCLTPEFKEADRVRIPLKRLLERLAGDITPLDVGVRPNGLLEGLLDRCIILFLCFTSYKRTFTSNIKITLLK